MPESAGVGRCEISWCPESHMGPLVGVDPCPSSTLPRPVDRWFSSSKRAMFAGVVAESALVRARITMARDRSVPGKSQADTGAQSRVFVPLEITALPGSLRPGQCVAHGNPDVGLIPPNVHRPNPFPAGH